MTTPLADAAPAAPAALAQLAASSKARIVTAVTQALAPVGALVAAVARNNAYTDAADVLARKDIAAALAQARVRINVAVTGEIRAAHLSAAAMGHVAALAQTKALGVASQVPSATPDYLTRLVDRWQASVDKVFAALPGQLDTAFAKIEPDPKAANRAQDLGGQRSNTALELFDRTAANLALRGSAGSSSAVVRGYEGSKLATFDGIKGRNGLVKEWETDKSPGHVPCRHCRLLDGLAIALGAMFPVLSDLEWFGNRLAPPRHPNCRCRLRIRPVSLTDAARAGRADDAPEPTMVSAADIRAMPDGKFRHMLSWLLKGIKALLKAAT